MKKLFPIIYWSLALTAIFTISYGCSTDKVKELQPLTPIAPTLVINIDTNTCKLVTYFSLSNVMHVVIDKTNVGLIDCQYDSFGTLIRTNRIKKMYFDDVNYTNL